MLVRIVRTTIKKYISKTKKKIESKEYLNKSREKPSDFTRKRKMGFVELIKFMVTRSKNSTQNALEKHFDKMGEEIYMSQQAYSEARSKVKVSAFTDLFYMTADIAYDGYYETYRGYRVSGIDGSKLALPDIEELGEIYGGTGANASSPTAQGSIYYDVLNKVIVDALIEPLKTDERTLALRHIGNLALSRKFEKELVIMDRGYASYELVRKLFESKVSFLIRVKRKYNLEIDAQTESDGYVVLRSKGQPDLKVRVLKFMLDSGEEEMLITDLFDEDMGIEDFKKLYFMRWPVETKYDEVKNKLEIENFTGWTKKAIEQDFYATMYLSNIAAAARWEAQVIVDDERLGKDNKYHYQVNVNHEIGVLKDRLIYALSKPNPSKEIEKIIFRLSKRVCPIKPDRHFDRNSSPRKSKHHYNSRSNS